jgi:hypothetical protein
MHCALALLSLSHTPLEKKKKKGITAQSTIRAERVRVLPFDKWAKRQRWVASGAATGNGVDIILFVGLIQSKGMEKKEQKNKAAAAKTL